MLGAAGLATLGLVVVALAVVLPGEDQPAIQTVSPSVEVPRGWVTVENVEAGITTAIPAHWQEFSRLEEGNAQEVLAVGSAPRPDEAPIGVVGCPASLPEPAVYVGLYEYPAGTQVYSEPGSDDSPYLSQPVRRPEDFARGGGFEGACVNQQSREVLRSVHYLFRDQGRVFAAIVSRTPTAHPDDVAAADQVLNTLVIRERTAPVPDTRTIPPDGWRIVDYEGFRTFLPPTWTVQENDCPGQARTLTLGSPSSRKECDEPDLSNTWIWLRPLTEVPEELARSCGPGYFNNIPGCQHIDFDTRTDSWFIAGLDVMLVVHHGPGGDPDYLAISNSWEYTDADRPEAAGPGGYPLSDVPEFMIAEDFAAAYVEGNCQRIGELADQDYAGGCPAPSSGGDPVSIVTSRQTSPGGAVTQTSAEVIVNPGGRIFQVTLQHEWLPNRGQSQWRVSAIQESDTPAPEAGPPLPPPNAT